MPVVGEGPDRDSGASLKLISTLPELFFRVTLAQELPSGPPPGRVSFPRDNLASDCSSRGPGFGSRRQAGSVWAVAASA